MNGSIRVSSSEEERVVFAADESNPERFFPQIASNESNREFVADDMPRVMDFEGVSAAPSDGNLLLCEDTGSHGIKFVSYHFCLRGMYLFYFDKEDVEEKKGPFPTYLNPPLGVIPLEQTAVEFPPGGRRVFREHAHTDARTGYELLIFNTPKDETEEGREPVFLVANKMAVREKWANAIRERTKISRHTILRAEYNSTTRKQSAAVAAAVSDDEEPASNKKFNASPTEIDVFPETQSRRSKNSKNSRRNKTVQQQVLESSDNPELSNAIKEFGYTSFNEQDWMNNFFETNNDFDAPTKCRHMEHLQADIKKHLKGAVLQQYEYFVQASGEMTSMGREVSSLKALIETQVETIKEMKDIDFSRSLYGDEIGGSGIELEPGRLQPGQQRLAGKNNNIKMPVAEDHSDVSSDNEDRSETLFDDDAINEEGGLIDVPDWLDEVAEDMTAIVRECRYNEAVELYNKAKSEISDLMDKHERPTAYRLTKRQLAHLEDVQKTLDNVARRISNRLEETLRRKNEGLRQASKRERSDLSSAMASLISPCALNDDAVYLQLLVKLGRTQQAAEAFSARRSLLLLETLHERPISGAGTVDLVIYAAQLSQSFFSCLATAVEKFLDLFLMSQTGGANGDKQEDSFSLGESSLHSNSDLPKGISSGAVASVVLWCDSELAKFASAFGGTRVLANLALSPPPRDAPKKPRVVGQEADVNGSKERKNAMEVAAQCVDQAFLYASQNLDSVGLPLTPRLAEYIRARLKGCESEVSLMLDERWQHLTSDWRTGDGYNSGMMDDPTMGR